MQLVWNETAPSESSFCSESAGQMTRTTPPTRPQSHATSQQTVLQIQILYEEALRHHRAGHFAEAEKAYRQILAFDSNHADALHLLGLIGYQFGHPVAAAEMIKKAVALRPENAIFRCNFGTVLQAQGKLSEACAQYEQALKLKPDYTEAHMNLGNTLQALGRRDQAIREYENALSLRPDYAEAHMNLGNIRQAEGNLQEAATRYEMSLALKPDFPEAHANFGNTLATQGKTAEAATHYQRALALKPNYPEAHLGLGNLLQEERQTDAAIAHYRQALTVRPNYPEAHLNLGNAMQSKGLLEEAAAHYRQALQLKPDFADALMNLGNILQNQVHLEEAIELYRQAIQIKPDYTEAHVNLGVVLQFQGKLDEAMAHYEQVLASNPNHVEAQLNKAINQLLRGNLIEGFRGYELRWHSTNTSSPARNFAQPQWKGESLQGASILIHAEQGLGDTIQFLRYVPMVLRAGGRVILEVPSRLRRLAAETPGIEQLLVYGEPLPNFDFHCPVMSLPLAFATEIDTIPVGSPYLAAPEKARDSARALHWPGSGLKVGIAWAGNPKKARDQFRSMKLSLLEPLLRIEKIHFFSLQMGEAAQQLDNSRYNITNLAPFTSDMADTAAQMEQLDLVITVDTSIAHLAGALGKPVWILLAQDADWRWLRDREDSPWYPTARLFRQKSLGNWKEPIEQVKGALVSLLVQ